MSTVTNVILTWQTHPMQDQKTLDAVNSFPGLDGQVLVSCDPLEGAPIVDGRDTGLGTRTTGWYGGKKYLEVVICIGAINYLDIDDFKAHLMSLDWEEQQREVQLTYQEQEDMRFSMWTLPPQSHLPLPLELVYMKNEHRSYGGQLTGSRFARLLKNDNERDKGINATAAERYRIADKLKESARLNYRAGHVDVARALYMESCDLWGHSSLGFEAAMEKE